MSPTASRKLIESRKIIHWLKHSASRFGQLTAPEARLLLETLLLLASIKLGLRFLPFRSVRHLVRCWSRVKGKSSVDKEVSGREYSAGRQAVTGRILQAVNCASVPLGATCLPRALAMQSLAARRGFRSELRIGVARGKKNALEAHAWVEDENGILIGRVPNIDQFKLLPDFDVE